MRYPPAYTLGLLCATLFSSAANAQSFARPTPQQAVSYAHLPLAFEANRGQVESHAAFVTQASGYSVRLGANETELVKDGATLRFRYLNAMPSPAITGREALPGKANYFIGNDPTRWHTNIPTFAKVEYRDVYRGINLLYYGRQSGLEYDLVVAPGADPGEIRMAVEGAGRLQLDAQGDLIVQVTGDESIRWHAPLIYQMKDGRRVNVRGSFALHGNVVGFRLGRYDRTQPLVIDPVLAFSTYGPLDLEFANAITLDSSGNIYVTGRVNPSGVFVLKLNAAGTAVIYKTRFGSSGSGIGIAVDSSGNVYVTGSTSASDFPLTNPLQASSGGATDAFVTVFSADGSRMLFSTYLGGSGNDEGEDIAVDASGNAYVTGSTSSSNFPTAKPVQSTFGGAGRIFQRGDAFVAKVNTVSATLAYSTYLGGSDDDEGSGIAVDAAGNAYVIGSTSSPNFPTARPFQAVLAGSGNAFLAKLDPSGTLLYSTYLGGSGNDAGLAIAVDGSGNAYLTGLTSSKDFPTASPLQSALASSTDAFVAKMNAAGSALIFSTYLGGAPGGKILIQSGGSGIALDAAGNVYVTGSTNSSSFPVSNPLQAFFGGGQCPVNSIFGPPFYPCSDVFVTKLNPSGTAMLYSTLLGGISLDSPGGIAVDATGNVYLAGTTYSNDFPILNALQPVGPSTIFSLPFVAKLADTGVNCSYSVSPASQSFAGGQATGTVTLSTPSGCLWRAVSNDPWLTISVPAFGAASRAVTFAVAGNSGPAARIGTLNIGGQTVTITQAGATSGCTYAISPANMAVDYSAGTSGLTVTAPAGCGWSAISGDGWIAPTTVTGTGTGVVYFSYPRSSQSPGTTQDHTLTIAGLLFTLTQAGFTADASSFEPALARTLPAGFYVVEATLAPGARGGFWGMEVLASKGQSAGGFNLGGSIYATVNPVGFGAFLLSTPQKVTATLNAQTPPGRALLMQFLDSQRKAVGTSVYGPPPLTLAQDLQPGFYVVEVSVSPGFTAPFTFQLGLAADFFVGGLDTGGYVGPGITGFGAFYLPEDQAVTIKLFGRNTYGSDTGAGSLVLTLKDASRKVLQVVQP